MNHLDITEILEDIKSFESYFEMCKKDFADGKELEKVIAPVAKEKLKKVKCLNLNELIVYYKFIDALYLFKYSERNTEVEKFITINLNKLRKHIDSDLQDLEDPVKRQEVAKNIRTFLEVLIEYTKNPNGFQILKSIIKRKADRERNILMIDKILKQYIPEIY